MAIQIRRADLHADRAALIGLFQKNLASDYDEQKFSWLYEANPHGAAIAWVAFDQASGEIRGASAGFPRKLHSDGTEMVGLILGDLCMDEEYRSLGPALQLQKISLAAVDEHPFAFCYDFPSQSMMAIYRRLGVGKTGTMQRWAKPLKADRKIERAIKSKHLSRPLAKAANLVLAHCGAKGSRGACELAIHEGPCGEEFTKLDEQLRSRPGLRTSRSAAYLNWRYLAHPSVQHEILVGRQKNVLVGYAVVATGSEDSAVVDLCALEDAVAKRLVYGATEHLRIKGAATVSLHAGEHHPWRPIFERAGFRPRESAPTVFYAPTSARISETYERGDWYLMKGERES